MKHFPAHFLILALLLGASATTAPVWSASSPLKPRQHYDWPQWRGPDRSNLSLETGLLKEWPVEGPPPAWTVTGLGDEIASVAMQHGRLVTLGRHEKLEYVVAMSASSGSFQWATALGPTTGRTSPMMRWLSARTPTMDGNLIFAISSEGELACLNAADGQVLWRRNYPEDFKAPLPYWGFCDYPLVDGEKLIIAPGGPEASVAALNKQTGELVWQSHVPEGTPAGYAACIAMQAGGVRQYVVLLDKVLAGINPEDGRVLWTRKAPRFYHHSYTPIAHAGGLISPHGYGSLLLSLAFESGPDGEMRVNEEHQLERLVRIEHEDMFNADLREADVVALFLPPRLMERLLPQLRELKPGARIVSHEFIFLDIPPDQTVEMVSVEGQAPHRIHLWTAPLKGVAD